MPDTLKYAETVTCKFCGNRIKWALKRPYNADDLTPHRCTKEVRVLTKDEIKALYPGVPVK